MDKKVSLVDRQSEMARVDKLVRDWGSTRVLCINAGGGIGKTRLLQEIRDRYKQPGSCLDPALPQEEPLRLALVQEFTTTDWSLEFLTGARNMAQDLGVSLEETDAHFDFAAMAQDLERVVDSKPDAIVVRLGSDERLRPALQRAVASGIPVLTFDNYVGGIDGLRARIMLDYSGKGSDLAEMLAADIDHRGQIAVIGVPGEAMQKRRRQILDTIALKYPDIQVVEVDSTMGEEMARHAYQYTEKVLDRYPRLKAIWVTWDEFTRGVVTALTDRDRSDIRVYGFDLCLTQIEYMLRPDSPWRASVAADPVELGRIVVRLASQAACGIELKSIYSLPTKMITQETLRELYGKGETIWSPSHVGWNPWLEPSPEAPGTTARQPLLVTDIIDFDNEIYHSPQNVGREMARMLGKEKFAPYYQALWEWRQMELSGTSADHLRKKALEANDVFVSCFNAISAHQRVLLFRDTTDALPRSSAWSYRLLGSYENTVTLIAGRDARSFGERLRELLGQGAVEIIDLEPLSRKDSEAYLAHKQEQLAFALEPELVERLSILAGGKPILLDLVADWRARDVPLAWVLTSSLEELQGLAAEPLAERQKEFERQLVSHIADTRQSTDWLILTMASIYPIDAGMAAAILKLPLEQAQALVEEVRGYVFVKSLPDGRVTLHDEMRRMVAEYAWPEVDPTGARRRDLNGRATAYLAQRIQELGTVIQNLAEQEDSGPVGDDTGAPMRAFFERDELEREWWLLQRQRLTYLLPVDRGAGVCLFAELVKQATKDYRSDVREQLMAQMLPYERALSAENLYIVESARAKLLLDTGKYDDAHKLVEEILTWQTVQGEKRIDMWIQRANLRIRRGDFEGGIEAFQAAVDLSREIGNREWLTRALNGLGWGYRLLNDYEEAIECYNRALVLSIEEEDNKTQAQVLNNLAFVYMSQARYSTALVFCDQALKLWHELGEERGLGALFTVYREIHRRLGDYELALRYNRRALEIFERQNDPEWLSQVQGGFGAIYLLQGNLELAEQYLVEARDMCTKKDRGWILHWLGRTLVEQGRTAEAAATLEEGYQVSRALPDIRYQIYCLWGLALIDAQSQDSTRLQWFEKEYRQYSKKWHARGISFPSAEGLLLKSLGDLALIDPSPAHTRKALKYYREALPKIAAHVTYGPFQLDSQLEDIGARLGRSGLSQRTIQNAAKSFYELWKDQGLERTSPEALLFFLRWQKQRKRNE